MPAALKYGVSDIGGGHAGGVVVHGNGGGEERW